MKPRSGRIYFDKRSNPDDDAPPVIDAVPVWPRSMPVARCDLYAHIGEFRIGDKRVSFVSGSESGVLVKVGQIYTIPVCDLSDWWVVGSEIGDVITWTAEVEP